MRKFLVAIAVLALAATPVLAADLSADTAAQPSCTYCGMDRHVFGHSRMLVTYADGSMTGLCSVRCAAVELANALDKNPVSIQVGDYHTRKLVDAEKAVWVIGGGKSGVMTKRAKWAFEKREDAEKFVKDNGGSIVTFDTVMKEAYGDLYEDTKMIRERRKMKRMQKPGGAQ